jgi:hypothetical protein
VVVGLQAERVRLAVSIEEAHPLGCAPGDAQDAVGDVDLVAAVDLESPALAFHDRGAREVDAEHPGLRWVDRRIVELDGDARGLRGDELVELHRLPHHRVGEEDDVHRAVEALQHRDGG